MNYSIKQYNLTPKIHPIKMLYFVHRLLIKLQDHFHHSGRLYNTPRKFGGCANFEKNNSKSELLGGFTHISHAETLAHLNNTYTSYEMMNF